MAIDLTSKYYLSAFQRVMCRSYNAQIKLLNSDGFDKIRSIIPQLDGFTKEDVLELENIISLFLYKKDTIVKPIDFVTFHNNYINNNNHYKILKNFLSPRLDKNTYSESLNKFYRDIITTSIYVVPPDGQDPIYCELKQYCRCFQLYYRLYYLSISYYVNNKVDKHDTPIVFENPVGYYDVSFKDELTPFITLVSNVWLKEYKETDIDIEKSIKELLSKIETINNKKLPFDLSHYLLSQLFAYQKISINTISNHIIKGFTESYVLIGGINYNIDIKKIPSEKIYRLFESIAFIRSEKVKTFFQQSFANYFLLQRESEIQELKSEIEKPFFQKTLALFNRKKTKNLNKEISKSINLKIEMLLSEYNNNQKTVLTLTSNQNYYSFKNELEINPNLCKITQFTINNKQFNFNLSHTLNTNIQLNSKNRIRVSIIDKNGNNLKNIEQDLNKVISSYLSKTKRGNKAKMHSRYHNFIQTMRHQLEKVEVNEITKRYEEITTHALQLSLAKHAIFFEYDAIENNLKPVVVRSNIMFADNVRKNIESEKIILAKIEERFNNLTDEEKTSSFSYKCIKQNQFISKYSTICEKEDEDLVENSIFACKLLCDYEFNSTVNIEELNEKDRIIFPVVSHNRKVGVLYLISDKYRHFQYNDRIRLANFVYNVGIELFEAKLFNTLTILNKATADLGLGGSVEKERKFKNEIVKTVANLFNSNAIVILWQEYITGSFSTFGLLGDNINYYFGENTAFANTDEIFKDHEKAVSIINIEESQAPLFKNLHKTSYKSCIRIPIYNHEQITIGWILLFDNHKSSISDSLNSEAKLLSQELFKAIETYYKNKNHMSFIQGLLTHDMNSKLRSIYGANSNLKKYAKYIYDFSEYNAFIKNCQDIETYTELGRQLLDFFATETSEAQIRKGAAKNVGVKAYCTYVKRDFIKFGKKSKANIYEAINSVLQSNKQFLNANNITFLIDAQPFKTIPKLWINHDIFVEIVENLVDNVRKYAIPNTKFIISLEKQMLGWDIIFENKGKRLPENIEKHTEDVFTHGLKFNKLEGSGAGLYYCREILQEYGCNLYLDYTIEDDNINANYSFRIHIYQALNMDFNIWI